MSNLLDGLIDAPAKCQLCGETTSYCQCEQPPPPEAPSDNGEPAKEEFPAPSNPVQVARQILRSWQHDGIPTLRRWCGVWMQWERTHWAEIDEDTIRSQLYRRLEHATFVQMLVVKGQKVPDLREWAPSKRKISDLMEAMAALCHLPESVPSPSWISRTDGADGPIVACRNGLLRLSDKKLLDLTPAFFNTVSVPFDYDAAAPRPETWLKFLGELWPAGDSEESAKDSADSIAAVQQWFGYTLSGRTHLHKILLILGPSRSGKGTIARILTSLIGAGNVAGPTMSSLTGNFGMASLVGKPLAIISDARLSGNTGHQVVERLLTISGEDRVEVDRKYKSAWTGRLPTRFLVLSNVLPQFGDSSGVIAHRFIVLSTIRSWLGNEDTELGNKLDRELTGILNWALEGLDDLNEHGRLTEPTSSVESVTAMKDIASPTSAFVRDWCVTGPDHSITVDLLWEAWKSWCDHNGRTAGGKQVFGRNLQSVAPRIRRTKPRINGRQVPTYAGIALKVANEDEGEGENEPNNEDLPGSTGSTGSDQGSGGRGEPREPVEPGKSQLLVSYSATCTVCGNPLNPTLASLGDTTHPNCEPARATNSYLDPGSTGSTGSPNGGETA